jgi:putative SOS response-associated peptidase YedK
VCYYKKVSIRQSDILKLLDEQIQMSFDFERPMQSGFDYVNWPVIVSNADCRPEVKLMEWGFIPNYLPNRAAVQRFRNGYKDGSGKFIPPITTLNAIGEELLLKPMYKDAALQRRCLVISSGFYEWRHLPKLGAKGQPLKATEKIPYHITVKGQPIFYCAGIWQNWTDKDSGETVDTFSLITTGANELMRQVHNSKNRMPCILTEQLAAEWISSPLPPERITQIASYQFKADDMEAYTIDRKFRENGNPIDPVIYDHVPPLV